ncbi:MAG: UPF0147 family protein [Candidatus Nanoarchaeia archaeon]|nr:UPF0147 family protein [Candidatus Nanoarchaeia archaeon]MDD5587947.1 UPF0147 family protein [Candidatus Nanoarchaeia archaeon]
MTKTTTNDREKIENIVSLLNQIEKEDTLPKSIKIKLQEIVCSMNDCKNPNINMKIDKAIQELDGVVEDPNLPSYAKMQIWNVVSLLESSNK